MLFQIWFSLLLATLITAALEPHQVQQQQLFIQQQRLVQQQQRYQMLSQHQHQFHQQVLLQQQQHLLRQQQQLLHHQQQQQQMQQQQQQQQMQHEQEQYKKHPAPQSPVSEHIVSQRFVMPAEASSGHNKLVKAQQKHTIMVSQGLKYPTIQTALHKVPLMLHTQQVPVFYPHGIINSQYFMSNAPYFMQSSNTQNFMQGYRRIVPSGGSTDKIAIDSSVNRRHIDTSFTSVGAAQNNYNQNILSFKPTQSSDTKKFVPYNHDNTVDQNKFYARAGADSYDDSYEGGKYDPTGHGNPSFSYWH